jgi:TPR repeat protein
LLYNEGAGVTKDRTQAFLWFHAAAKAGHPVAQFNLACLYLLGEGRVKNYTKALYWFEASSNNGVDKAAHNFSILSKVIKVPKLERSEIPKLYGIDSVGQLSRIINDLSVKTYNQTRHELESSHNNKLLGKKDEKLNKLVFNIQKKLKLDGFYVGSLDGFLGPNTESAIRVYQLEHGFKVSGIPSLDLLKRMENTPSR